MFAIPTRDFVQRASLADSRRSVRSRVAIAVLCVLTLTGTLLASRTGTAAGDSATTPAPFAQQAESALAMLRTDLFAAFPHAEDVVTATQMVSAFQQPLTSSNPAQLTPQETIQAEALRAYLSQLELAELVMPADVEFMSRLAAATSAFFEAAELQEPAEAIERWRTEVVLPVRASIAIPCGFCDSVVDWVEDKVIPWIGSTAGLVTGKVLQIIGLAFGVVTAVLLVVAAVTAATPVLIVASAVGVITAVLLFVGGTIDHLHGIFRELDSNPTNSLPAGAPSTPAGAPCRAWAAYPHSPGQPE